MQRNTKRIVGKGVVCLLCFLLGGVATLGITWHLLGQDGRTLLQAHQLIEKRFVGEYDPAENLSATLETMVDSLGDRWSYYLDPEEAQRTREARSNAYVGIGVTVSQEPSDGLEIVGVTAGSPAQEAGLQVGEIIRAVDGQAIQPETREEAVEAIKGEEGTWLTLEVEAADGTRRTVELQRKQVHGITAAWKLLEDQVGLVTIQNFYAGTADLVKQGVAELQAQGARALVFDVRNNPGGYVTELTEILDDLLRREGDGLHLRRRLCGPAHGGAGEQEQLQRGGVLGRPAPGVRRGGGGRGADQRQGLLPGALRPARRQRHWAVHRPVLHRRRGLPDRHRADAGPPVLPVGGG